MPPIDYLAILQSGEGQVPTFSYIHCMCATQVLLYLVAYAVY